MHVHYWWYFLCVLCALLLLKLASAQVVLMKLQFDLVMGGKLTTDITFLNPQQWIGQQLVISDVNTGC